MTPCNYLNGELDGTLVSVEGVSGIPLHGDELRHCVLVEFIDKCSRYK